MQGVENNKTAQERIARLISLSAPGIWDWEISSNSFIVTERFREILGIETTDAIDFQSVLALTHPEDRSWAAAITNSSGEPATPFTVRYRINRRDGEIRWISSRIWPHEGATAAAGYTGTITDVTEEMATAAALAQSEQRLRYAIEAGKMAVWEVDLDTGDVSQSVELNHLFGFPADTFMTLEKARSCYNPGEHERLMAERHTAEAVRARAAAGDFALRTADGVKSGDDRTQLQAEVAITARTGQPKRLMLRAQYAAAPDGRPKLTGLLFDITETKMAEERSVVVARELQHRVKNSLAVISALAAQSFRGKDPAQTELKNFQSRLNALSSANDLILSTNSETANLQDLIESIIQPYHSGAALTFELEGPPVNLPARTATSIGMVLHELCTNAVKYGALSVPSGLVSIRWSVASSRLHMTWQERNGPPPSGPARRGFGVRLLENVIRNDLGGALSIDFQPAGLLCSFEIPIDR